MYTSQRLPKHPNVSYNKGGRTLSILFEAHLNKKTVKQKTSLKKRKKDGPAAERNMLLKQTFGPKCPLK